jgi:NADH-quinone oxidoreductase subunit C
VTEAYGDVHVDVPDTIWLVALEAAYAQGLCFFDWLSAYEDRAGLAVVAHLVGANPGDRVLLRTLLALDGGSLPTATVLWPGAAWHERETWEMFGVDFAGHPRLEPLLLQPEFSGRPLRKDFVLASRAVKDWPGTKDPADSGDQAASGRRSRRRTPRPLGVPEGWGSE